MMLRLTGAALLFSVVAACASGEDEAPAWETAGEEMAVATDAASAAEAQCQPMTNVMAVEERQSPYDSVTVELGGQAAKVCYGRPSMRGREIMGGLLPYDTLWRTGANEPTTIHLPFAAEIAGIPVEAGSYSIYTVPGEEQWSVIVNASTSQWGIESAYTEAVRAEEIARAQVPAETIPETVETFTIETEPTGQNSAEIVLQWENTRVRVPIVRT